MNPSDLDNKSLICHLEQLTNSIPFGASPPEARAIFVEAINRLRNTNADRALAGACRKWLRGCSCTPPGVACFECLKSFHAQLYNAADEHGVPVGPNHLL